MPDDTGVIAVDESQSRIRRRPALPTLCRRTRSGAR
jgi:hypothetical protein